MRYKLDGKGGSWSYQVPNRPRHLTVYRDAGDLPIATESKFWHKLKLLMNSHGNDMVKKIMSKDGHMVGGDTYPYYLRSRDWSFCVHDANYAIRALHKDYKERGKVELAVEWDVKQLKLGEQQ